MTKKTVHCWWIKTVAFIYIHFPRRLLSWRKKKTFALILSPHRDNYKTENSIGWNVSLALFKTGILHDNNHTLFEKNFTPREFEKCDTSWMTIVKKLSTESYFLSRQCLLLFFEKKEIWHTKFNYIVMFFFPGACFPARVHIIWRR